MTPEQNHLVERAKDALWDDGRIEAAWLAGSLGRGGGDQFSDVDLLAYCAAGTAGEVSRHLADRVDAIAEPLLVNILFGGRVLNLVLEGWRRLDVSLIEAAELPRYDGSMLTPLFNRTGVQPAGSYPPAYRTSPETLLALVNEFIRILGLASVGAGRQEYFLMMAGVEHLRRLTLDLMLEENGIGPWARGGALSRLPLLTADQRAQLDAMPPLAPTRESTLEGHAAVARIFLPRARRLATAIAAGWPERFEQATRDHLANTIGLTI